MRSSNFAKRRFRRPVASSISLPHSTSNRIVDSQTEQNLKGDESFDMRFLSKASEDQLCIEVEFTGLSLEKHCPKALIVLCNQSGSTPRSQHSMDRWFWRPRNARRCMAWHKIGRGLSRPDFCCHIKHGNGNLRARRPYHLGKTCRKHADPPHLFRRRQLMIFSIIFPAFMAIINEQVLGKGILAI